MLKKHTIRTKDRGTKTFSYARTLAVRLFCTECLGWETDPKDCTSPLCPLFPFRRRTQSSLKGDPGTQPKVQGAQKSGLQ